MVESVQKGGNLVVKHKIFFGHGLQILLVSVGLSGGSLKLSQSDIHTKTKQKQNKKSTYPHPTPSRKT